MRKFSYKKLTYHEMAEIVDQIRIEVKRRNPIFVNAYIPAFQACICALDEISHGEFHNRTSESGPKES